MIHSGQLGEPSSISARNHALTSRPNTSRRLKNPAGRRRVVLRQAAHTGTDRWNVVSVPRMPKKRVTRVPCTSFTQLVSPQLQQKPVGNSNAGLWTSIGLLHGGHDELGAP